MKQQNENKKRMEGWKEYKIKELGSIVTGNTPPRSKSEFYGSHTLFVKPTDIEKNTKHTYKPEECYSELAYEKYKRSLIPKGSTCVVTIGSIGEKITKAHCNLFINQAMNAVVANDNFDKDFVFYLLKQNLGQLKLLDSGTASGRENVSKSSFSNIKVKAPVNKETQALQKDGTILDDFEENEIKLQGEAPSIIRGNDHFYFSHGCPEVNLFEDPHSLITGYACTNGSYDKDRKSSKKKVHKSKHFSECAEFNKYQFDQNQSQKRKISTRKRIPNKTKMLLQKEISSECPFCESTDVEHFQIHHIDENPSNNSFENLLMLCPTCHSKITKGDIEQNEVVYCKERLKN